MMRLVLLAALLSISSSEDAVSLNPFKQSYVCPPKFIRQGHRCYFFSKEAITWSEALFQCREMHSNLAIIQNRNQDKLIRSFLSKKTLDPLERWLGGVYDWGKMAWKWAAPGKPLAYNGFSKEVNPQDPETLRWHCIIMDPTQQYFWSSRSCVERKHYICQTRLKTVNNRDKKRLQRQYKASKDNRLNEIPVPYIPDFPNNTTALKYNALPITYHFEPNDKLSDNAMFAYKSPEYKKPVRRNGQRKKKSNSLRPMRPLRLANGTVIERPRKRVTHRRRKQRKPEDLGKPTLIKNIRWKTYKKNGNLPNPLYPRPIVEEYNYVKGG
ncbi:uncharacterized protein LOC114336078 [Diabrotica virgifera virgifera]|uniref:Uncharacterized protein LOC114348996 n=1 Tax=Diabrotica virgifera virgifera TaxID=50390 RepID=A0A6P7H9B1_DIAVI|nr:uncharacterized protein LOC114336078 [Diabrotica virgifera virgifera]XP_050501453.1 uncharacterized protein LOC114336078 [Diabrotica virgifera virgifera]